MSDVEEKFLGGVAGVGMNRTLRGFKSSFYVQTGGPSAYGIYLTDKRLIGVSYRKIVSEAYRPAYAIFLLCILSLISLVVYTRLTGAQDLPPLPFVMALAVVALVLLIYWSPKRASARLERESSGKSLPNFGKIAPDIILNRTGISQVTFRPGLILVAMRSGETQTFLTKAGQKKGSQLLRLFLVFCSTAPLIEMTVSNVGGENLRKLVEPTSPDGREGWITVQRPTTGKEERFRVTRKLLFEEAAPLPNAYAILEGEWGYQCYLTSPMASIKCGQAGLRQLLLDLDSICCDAPEGESIRYE